jgi:two-component system NtrC family sensor kinase
LAQRVTRPLKTPYRVRLHTRFLLYFTTLIVVIMSLVVLLVERGMNQIIERQARKRGLSIAHNLAAVSQPSLVTYNYVALNQNAERAKRDEEGIADVIILNKEGRVAAYSQHGHHQGTVLTDPVSQQAAATSADLVLPVEIERRDGSGVADRGLDIAVPVYIENSTEKWGTVRIRMLTEDMHRQIRDTRLLLIGLGLGAVGLGVLGSFFMARHITGPLSHLVDAAVRAAGGDLGTRIEIGTGDEIEELARNFNEMIGQIETNQTAVEELNRGLEESVRIRTEDLSRANEALREAYDELQQAEAQMVLQEKMASLGQFVAGIAHEINTPSSAINAAIFNISGYLETLTRQIPELLGQGVPSALESRFYGIIGRALAADATRNKRASTAEIRQRSRELESVLQGRGFKTSRELALTFSRLGLHEEIAELVQEASGDSPGACLGFLENVGNLAIAVNDIRLSIDAITRMVKALKGYSHQDHAVMADADIHDGIETTLTILRNQIKYGIVVERKYSRLPAVTCNTNELNQVWTNIIHNAVQAMKGMGTLTIETYRKQMYIGVRISDTGPGIPDGIRSRIFDPFFTTKDQGEGSGLGLGISQQIVQRHRGRISVDSEPGRTSFEVLLPLQLQPAEQAKA